MVLHEDNNLSWLYSIIANIAGDTIWGFDISEKCYAMFVFKSDCKNYCNFVSFEYFVDNYAK